jgi:hypothetical protein
MVFGILIDVPIIVGVFIVMMICRKELSSFLARIPLPVLATSILVSVPLIILEEQIDCMPAWCGQVLIPPTVPFLLIEVLVVSLIALRVHAKSPIRVASAYSIFGVFWELLFGGLVGAPLIIAVIFAPYVWVGYAFVSLLPLSILLTGRRNREPTNVVAG